MASGAIALDLVMLFVAAAAGRNAVGNGHGHRSRMASGAGKLVPVVAERDGSSPWRSTCGCHRHFDFPRRGHFGR